MQKLLIIVIVSFLLLKLTACKKHGKTTDTNNLQNYYPYDTYTDTVIKYFADNISGWFSNIHKKVKADTFNNNFQFISHGDSSDYNYGDTISFHPHPIGSRQFQSGFSYYPISLTDSNTSINRLIFSRGNFPPDFNENTDLAAYQNNYLVDDFEFLKLYWSKDSLLFKYIMLKVDTFSFNNYKIITARTTATMNFDFMSPIFIPEK